MVVEDLAYTDTDGERRSLGRSGESIPLNLTVITDKRVFVAGATGAIGRVLCRLLVSDGWHVVGTTRNAHAAGDLDALGVEPAVVDVFDEEALRTAVIDAQPTAVIHQLTDLPQQLRPEEREKALARNARIREVGTKHLVDACAAARVGHVIAQSIAFAYAPGPQPFSEENPLDVNASDPVAARTARAVQTLESLVLNGPFRGIVLRYGRFYGPGTWASAPSADTAVHVEAAADAARLALLRGNAGIYNVAEPGGTVSITKAVGQLGWSPAFRDNR
jgi:nucleoside-diphosphate-sugar epimerase